jgi:hypothetical protein
MYIEQKLLHIDEPDLCNILRKQIDKKAWLDCLLLLQHVLRHALKSEVFYLSSIAYFPRIHLTFEKKGCCRFY